MIIDTELPETLKLANFKRHVNNKPLNVLLQGLRIQNSFHRSVRATPRQT